MWLWVVQVVTGDSQEEVMIFRDKQTLHHNIYIMPPSFSPPSSSSVFPKCLLPSFHILRFKRAAQLRPSHKGCGRENFLNFGFGFKNDQMLFCISGGKQRNTSVRFPNCHNASGLGNLNRKY